MDNYKKNLKLLSENHVYSKEMEHDACGVGVIASTEGKKSREIVEYGIQALKAVWHRGAVDADGKTGDGAGIHVEIPKDFFIAVAASLPSLIAHTTNEAPLTISPAAKTPSKFVCIVSKSVFIVPHFVTCNSFASNK